MSASETRSIVVEYQLPRPPERVWRALVDPALLAEWLMPNDIQPVIGHRFTFRAQPIGDWDGVVRCQVLEVQPNKLLRYSWIGGGANPAMRLETTVTWTLTPSGGGTTLRLEHAGFSAANAFAYDNMGKGWRGKLAERLQQVLDRAG